MAQVIAAFTFVSVFLVDKNNDGRPDAAEKEAKKELKKMHLKCQCYHRNLEERTNHD